MKVGSLVVVKPLPKKGPDPSIIPFIRWMPNDDESTIYTIRDIEDNSAVFEEGCIGHLPFNLGELSISVVYLREIQPPMDISELLADTIEIITAEPQLN